MGGSGSRFSNRSDDLLWARNVNSMAGRSLTQLRTGSLGHLPLGGRRDHVVVGCYEIVARLLFRLSECPLSTYSGHSPLGPAFDPFGDIRLRE